MNNKSFLVLIGIAIVCLGLYSCPNDDYGVQFEIRNNSDASIYFALSYSYPDTSLTQLVSVPYYNGNLWQKLAPHEGKYEGRGEFDLNSTTLVFVFDANVIETTP